MNFPDYFVSCDWGTSSFRLRLIESTQVTVIAEVRSGHGIRSLHDTLPPGTWTNERDAAFAGFLGEKLGELMAHVPAGIEVCHVMISGMASSTIGWRELPYSPVPLQLDGSNVGHERIALKTKDDREFEVFLISGVRTDRDIMRGEETEVLGILNHPLYVRHARSSVIVLPGTHSKHILVQDGRIIDWHTFMTGELFEVLTTATILKATTEISSDEPNSPVEAGDAFREGVVEGFDSGMEAGIFRARVRGVLDGASNAANREFLSGLLIGSELRQALQMADGRPLLIAEPTVSKRYERAFEAIWKSTVNPNSPFPQVVVIDLPEGGAALYGHAFLLKRWLGAAEIPRT